VNKIKVLFMFVLVSYEINASARCGRVPVENFSADFKISAIKKVEIACLFDEKGMLEFKKINYVEQKGCILELEFVKLNSGKIPTETKPKNEKYGVYAKGEICDSAVGTRVSKKIESNVSECCSERERGRIGKIEGCTMKPEPKLLTQPSENYIKCYDSDVNWQFVEK
jgi:hypothetical protein